MSGFSSVRVPVIMRTWALKWAIDPTLMPRTTAVLPACAMKNASMFGRIGLVSTSILLPKLLIVPGGESMPGVSAGTLGSIVQTGSQAPRANTTMSFFGAAALADRGSTERTHRRQGDAHEASSREMHVVSP